MDDLTPEREPEIRALRAKLMSPEYEADFQRGFAAIRYEAAVYADVGGHNVMWREAKAADALRVKNGRPRPPHYGILTWATGVKAPR
jgi:hypothetical protein